MKIKTVSPNNYPSQILTQKRAGNFSGVINQNNISFKGGVPLTILDPIIKNKYFQSLLNLSVKNPSLFDSTIVLALATTIRPATILAIPGPPKEDRQYAAAKSIATGIIGVIVSALIYIPFEKGLRTFGPAAVEKFCKNPKAAEAFNYIVNKGSKLIIGPLDAMLLFKLIPPIMKRVFPNSKKQDPTPPPFAAKLNEDQQKVFTDFVKQYGNKGGLR